jgi:hypothetical protein
VLGRAGPWQRSPNPSRALNENPAVVRRRRSNLPRRSATGLEFETEEREIASDLVAEVSRGRSSCASGEDPNGPGKGVKGAMSMRRLNNRQAAEKPVRSGLPGGE